MFQDVKDVKLCSVIVFFFVWFCFLFRAVRGSNESELIVGDCGYVRRRRRRRAEQ